MPELKPNPARKPNPKAVAAEKIEAGLRAELEAMHKRLDKELTYRAAQCGLAIYRVLEEHRCRMVPGPNKDVKIVAE